MIEQWGLIGVLVFTFVLGMFPVQLLFFNKRKKIFLGLISLSKENQIKTAKVLNIAKGLLLSLVGTYGYWTFNPDEQFIWGVLAIGVIGHFFSPWIKKKGDDLSLVALGAVSLLEPWTALGGLCIFGFTYWSVRRVVVSTLMGVFGALFFHVVVHSLGWSFISFILTIFLILVGYESEIDSILEKNA